MGSPPWPGGIQRSVTIGSPEASLEVPVLYAASGIPRTISIPGNRVPDNHAVGTGDCMRSRQGYNNGKRNSRDGYGNARSHKYGREESHVTPSSGPDPGMAAAMTNTPMDTEEVDQPLASRAATTFSV